MTSHSAIAVSTSYLTTSNPGRPPRAGKLVLTVSTLRPGRPSRTRQGEAALGAVRWGILERVGRCGRLRIETIPATWPMTRHLVRRLTERMLAEGLLERLPNGAVTLSAAGSRVREAERRRRGA